MPARTQWPSVSVKVAFVAGVFTETTLGATAGPVTAISADRGRQYELARTEAGTGKATFENFDGRYTPNNATSPYVGNLKLFREYTWQATWSAVTYDVSRGFVERFPTDFSDAGNFAWTNVDLVDAFAMLAGQTARSVADYEVLTSGPTFLYKFDEPQDSVSAGDSISPATNPSATIRASKHGAGTVTFGAETGLADAATGVHFDNGRTDGLAFVAASALVLAYAQQNASFVPTSGGWTLEMWVQTPTTKPAVGYQYTLMLQSSETGQYVETSIFSAGGFNAIVGNNGVGASSPAQSINICDGQVHHLVLTFAADQKTTQTYVDGVSVGTNATASALSLDKLAYHSLGARISGNTQGYQFPGTIMRYARYPSVLSGARILAQYQAGATAFAGEDSGARISRILTYAGWPGALSDIGSGSGMAGPAITEGTSILELIQSTADDELGTLWVSGAGKITFRGRQIRQTTLTSAFTFGENTAGGEIPYQGDVHFDYDPTFVYDEVKVSRTNGATVMVRAATSVLPYHRTLERTLGVNTDAEATDQANWLLVQYASPKMRVGALTIEPSANPVLWPTALGTEVNTRVTVKRRAIGQPLFSIDCWVEAVAHSVTPASWKTTFLLSPVDSPRMGLWDTDNWDDTNAVWGF